MMGATFRTLTGTGVLPVPSAVVSVACLARVATKAMVGPSNDAALKLADVPLVSYVPSPFRSQETAIGAP